MEKYDYKTLLKILKEWKDFSVKVRDESHGNEPLKTYAESQIKYAVGLKSLVDKNFIGDGVDDSKARFPEAEIFREPLKDVEFSCTPTFIIGCRRSGTTLLASLLNASENISVVPEMFLAGSIAQSDSLLHTAYRAIHMLGETYAHYFCRFGKFVDNAYIDYARVQKKNRWIAKELRIPHRLDILDEMFGYKARFIYIMRHGLSVARSCAMRFPSRDGFPFNNDTSFCVETYMDEWVKNNERTMDFYERNRERCIIVRYEELTEYPALEMKKVFDFVGEEWEDSILETFGDQSFVGMGDNKIKAMEGKIVKNSYGWSDWPHSLLSVLGRKVNPTLRRLGYDEVG